MRQAGKIKWFDDKKGFGFLTTDEGKDVFVHFSAVAGSGRRKLETGVRVEFDVVDGIKGPAAENVTLAP